MTLKFQIFFPVEDLRFPANYCETLKQKTSLLEGAIRLLVCDIVVSGITDGENSAKLTFSYEEVYAVDSTIDGVMKRAEQFARDFCTKIGIGAA